MQKFKCKPIRRKQIISTMKELGYRLIKTGVKKLKFEKTVISSNTVIVNDPKSGQPKEKTVTNKEIKKINLPQKVKPEDLLDFTDDEEVLNAFGLYHSNKIIDACNQFNVQLPLEDGIHHIGKIQENLDNSPPSKKVIAYLSGTPVNLTDDEIVDLLSLTDLEPPEVGELLAHFGVLDNKTPDNLIKTINSLENAIKVDKEIKELLQEYEF